MTLFTSYGVYEVICFDTAVAFSPLMCSIYCFLLTADSLIPQNVSELWLFCEVILTLIMHSLFSPSVLPSWV